MVSFFICADDNDNEEHQPREMGRKQKGKSVDKAEDRAKQTRNIGAANRGKVSMKYLYLTSFSKLIIIHICLNESNINRFAGKLMFSILFIIIIF